MELIGYGLEVQHQEFLFEYMYQHGLDSIPSISLTTRPIDQLKADPQLWRMSLIERDALYDTWYTAASESIRRVQLEYFKELRERHATARTNFQEAKDQVCFD